MAISKQQSMRPAEIELIDASNQHESTLQAHAQSLETLDENLTTETANRESADTALGTRIDNEVQARTDADTALGTRIDGEVQARTDADTALGTRIDDEVQARTDADTALGTRIDNETQERTDADTALGTRIDNETQARTDADNALGTRIDGEVQARTDADTALGTRIDNEVQARTDGDATLQGQIDALVAVGAEPNVIDSISVNGVEQTVTDKNVNINVPNSDTISCVATQSDIAFVAYTSASKDNGIQLKYNISSGKYYVVAKYNGTWQAQKEI